MMARDTSLYRIFVNNTLSARILRSFPTLVLILMIHYHNYKPFYIQRVGL